MENGSRPLKHTKTTFRVREVNKKMNDYTKQLAVLAEMSNKYGADPAYVLAGGGNTSYKSKERLWVKGSGTALATIRPEDFVVLEREKLAKMWTVVYPENEAARESAVLSDMMAARAEGENRRPSVETLLHDLFPQSYVLHVHPAIVNGLTCSNDGERAMNKLFPEAVWVDACKPGYILALECKEKMDAYKAATGKECNLLFLQNHGIFFAGDTTEELDVLAEHVMSTLASQICHTPQLEELTYDTEAVKAISQEIGKIYGENAVVRFTVNPEILSYDPDTKSLSPDHIVYAKARQLSVDVSEDIINAFNAFDKENGYKPKIIFVRNLGMFSCGLSENEADTAQVVMLDAIKVVAYAKSFGGVSPMPDFLIDFIVNWEVESYRSKVSLGK